MLTYLVEFFAIVSLIAIPIYISNGLALVFGGGPAMDFGKRFFDGKELLGEGKTFRGTLAGIFFGSLGGAIVAVFIPQLAAFLPVDYFQYAVLLSMGAMLGDIAASFVKRRLGIERGAHFFLIDQLDFLVGGIALGAIMFVPAPEQVVFLAVFTFSMHKFANLIAFQSRMKKVPW